MGHLPLFVPKSVTIYTENYTFLFHDKNIWPKYAILGMFA